MNDDLSRAKAGPQPFRADFETEFTLTPRGPSRARLRVEQRGFPRGAAADAHLAACERGWSDIFAGIRRYLAG